jgi:hypothetical protein
MICMGYPNWFKQGAINYFNLFLPERYANKPLLDFLQIGAYTGDATEWIMDNIITDKTSWLTDVDTWCGSEEEVHKQFNWADLENLYDSRISKYTNVCKMKGYSSDFLQNAESEHYDFIYIDGDHRADEVYKDAIFGWRCLKKGGIMAFDDYRWVHDSKDPQMAPQPGIDKFLSEYSNDLSIMAKDLQVWVYKNE